MTISTRKSSDGRRLHVEVPGCVVNIYVGFGDHKGREVTAVEIIADGSRYAGEPAWWLNGKSGNDYVRLRIVCEGGAV